MHCQELLIAPPTQLVHVTYNLQAFMHTITAALAPPPLFITYVMLFIIKNICVPLHVVYILYYH
jgi:hypothetical protein